MSNEDAAKADEKVDEVAEDLGKAGKTSARASKKSKDESSAVRAVGLHR